LLPIKWQDLPYLWLKDFIITIELEGGWTLKFSKVSTLSEAHFSDPSSQSCTFLQKNALSSQTKKVLPSYQSSKLIEMKTPSKWVHD
jgi:hypothetical protein